MNFGNGGFNPVPESNIWSTNVPNGTYGVITPSFGYVGNSNTSPQISGTTIIKGDGYVKYVQSNGDFTVVSSNGLVSSGCGHW